jgi:hypothetical protein
MAFTQSMQPITFWWNRKCKKGIMEQALPLTRLLLMIPIGSDYGDAKCQQRSRFSGGEYPMTLYLAEQISIVSILSK